MSLLKHLTEGELTVSGRLVDASNATLFGQCTFNQVEIPVIYKPIAGERPLWDFPDGNLAKRERAAFLISELGSWNLVPLTILREGPFGEGMVQLWIDLDESIELADFYSSDDPRLRAMAIFDAVINNSDRKIGHLLPTQDGALFGCDHGVTFHEEDKLRTVLWRWAGQRFSSDEIEQLIELRSTLAIEMATLTALVTENEFAALMKRVNRLIETGTFPEPSDDWPAVPWPPF
jgi:hypothetical protein|uniref:SCO1664 family protein n=1 Tax=Candidatus Planktophila sp. TaxID=2175601 RepID=UPI00404AD62C